MAVYTNVNESLIRSIAKEAKDEMIDYENSLYYINGYSYDMLEIDAKKNFLDSIDKIIESKSINGSIATLENKLNVLISACDEIGKTHEIEKKISSLEPKLYKTVSHSVTNADGTVSRYTTTVIDQNVKSRIDSLKGELNRKEKSITAMLS